MNIKCPNCSHCFPVSDDGIFLDYSDYIDYDDSGKRVWEELPLLRSQLSVKE